ncbi:hypothetical protein DPMN_027744 [Dreissena polymorpha]|uniref:Uncharacterized protein n=1 Tax=Dreissena polymorpha TaxID=45954 RepID=A0A9D4REN0_DREPO|nr:hypothetical protein DPMN_027744 [Dreissena polymorpha]
MCVSFKVLVLIVEEEKVARTDGRDNHNIPTLFKKRGDNYQLKQEHRLAGADRSSIFLLKVKGPISILESQRRKGVGVERGV